MNRLTNIRVGEYEYDEDYADLDRVGSVPLTKDIIQELLETISFMFEWGDTEDRRTMIDLERLEDILFELDQRIE